MLYMEFDIYIRPDPVHVSRDMNRNQERCE